MIQALPMTDILTENKIKLSIPLVANLMLKGLKQVDIARTCNITRQTVNAYIKKHLDELLPLLDESDRLVAIKARHIADKSLNVIDDIINTTDDFGKRDLISLNVVAGTQIDKHRLLSNQSTSNISVDQVTTNINANQQAINEMEAKLKQLE